MTNDEHYIEWLVRTHGLSAMRDLVWSVLDGARLTAPDAFLDCIGSDPGHLRTMAEFIAANSSSADDGEFAPEYARLAREAAASEPSLTPAELNGGLTYQRPMGVVR